MSHLVLLSALSCAASLAAQDYAIGQYLEDRSSRVYGCPCEWSNEYVNEGREAILAWNIQAGEFHGVDLSGLRMVAVLVSTFNLGVPDSLRRSTVFLDQAAPESRRRAGEEWLRARYGDLLGRILGVHTAPIDFSLAPDRAAVEIKGMLRLQIRRAVLAQDTRDWATLLYDPLVPMASATMASTLLTEYRGPDLRIRWIREGEGITRYYGTFATP